MDIDLNEWDFVATNGLFLVGKVDKVERRRLSPVYEVLRPFSPTTLEGGQPTLTQQFLLRPFLSLPPGLREFRVPEGAARVCLAAFELRELKQVIAQTVENERVYRAQAVGIVLPGSTH